MKNIASPGDIASDSATCDLCNLQQFPNILGISVFSSSQYKWQYHWPLEPSCDSQSVSQNQTLSVPQESQLLFTGLLEPCLGFYLWNKKAVLDFNERSRLA